MFGKGAAKKGRKPLAKSAKSVRKPVVEKAVPKKVKKAKSGGASRVVDSESKFAFDFSGWHLPAVDVSAWLNIRFVIVAVALLVLMCAVYVSFITVENVMNVAVENVKIKGQLRYQSEVEVGEIINRYTSDGFVNVDLNDLHAELAALPWIHSVIIKRQLPDDLIVTLKEEQAVARWNDDSFINNLGQVFTPDIGVEIPGIVRFKGKHHKKVLSMYKRVESLLNEKQKPIISLAMNQRQVITVKVKSGSILIMNGDELDMQLMRWNKIVDRALIQQLDDIKQADLRYNNGAAVSWKPESASRKKVLGNR